MLQSFSAYLATTELSPRTQRAYTDALSVFAKWFAATNGHALSRENLTSIDAREWRQSMMAAMQAPATINARLAALRYYAAWCQIPISVRSVKQQSLAPRWLDRLEQARLLREAERAANAPGTDLQKAAARRTHAIIVLLIHTGLRIGELTTLQPADIESSERSGTLTVRADVGKGGKARAVALNKDARLALASLPLPLGLSARSVQLAIAELARRAGVKCTPHTFRHTFAHNLIASGGAEAQAQALLGHTDPRATRRYTTPGQAELQKAVELME